MKLDQKALEAAELAAQSHLWPDLPDGMMAGAIIAYLSASVPADVAGLVAEIRSDIAAHEVTSNGQMRRVAAMRNAADVLASLSAKVEELTRENARIRKAVAQVCVALGNGAHIDPDCTVEFMEFVPTEVGLVVGNLRTSLAERDRIIAEKDKALELVAESGKFSCFDDEAWSTVNAAREQRMS